MKGWLLAVAGLSCTRSRPRMEVRRLGYIVIMFVTIIITTTMCHLLKNSSFSWPSTCCWLLAGDCGRPRPTGTRARLGAVGVKLGSWPRMEDSKKRRSHGKRSVHRAWSVDVD